MVNNKIIMMPSPGCGYQGVGKNIADRVNQQERLIRLARLGMLIECEGSITIGTSLGCKSLRYCSFSPQIDITNTSSIIIDEAKNTLVSESIGFTARPVRYGSGFGKKLRYDLNIHGFDRLVKILSLLKPWLGSKARNADLVLEFIKSRQTTGGPGTPYSESEWQMVTEVRIINGRSLSQKAIAKVKAQLESSESIRQPRTREFHRRYLKMCADLQRELERTAEMTVPPAQKTA